MLENNEKILVQLLIGSVIETRKKKKLEIYTSRYKRFLNLATKYIGITNNQFKII